MEGTEVKYGRKNALIKQIELGWGFGELRVQLDSSDGDKIWKANGEAKRQEEV